MKTSDLLRKMKESDVEHLQRLLQEAAAYEVKRRQAVAVLEQHGIDVEVKEWIDTKIVGYDFIDDEAPEVIVSLASVLVMDRVDVKDIRW